MIYILKLNVQRRFCLLEKILDYQEFNYCDPSDRVELGIRGSSLQLKNPVKWKPRNEEMQWTPTTMTLTLHDHSFHRRQVFTMKELSSIYHIPPTRPAFPPWHASFFVGVLLGVSIVCLPEDIDELATVETFTRRIFPTLVSLPALVIVRLGIAISCWVVTIHMVFSSSWTIDTTYRPESRLQNTTLKIEGPRTLCPFTSWAWIMLASTFSITGYIALMAHLGRAQQIEQWVLRSALVLWELSAPFAILVSAVVRYAIWPIVLATGKSHKLGSFRNQMQHNINSVYALSEMALLGGLPLKFSHLSLPCLVGSLYILFSWFSCRSYARPEYGPQYLYWFMDPTLGNTTTLALVALLSSLILSFVIFFMIGVFVEMTGASVIAHLLSVWIVSSAVIRTE